MDFTQKIYKQLLKELLNSGYLFQTFEQFVTAPAQKVVVLRHDVDKLPENAVDLAKIETGLGIRASYYYRIVKQSNVPEKIKAVRDLGHEIGYHYEDLTLAMGNYEEAIRMFRENLNYFRAYYEVKTACMHGSPLSKWDNRLIWEKYNYKDYGIIAEPYFDVDYQKVFYLTDTGRNWNNTNASVRDKVDSKFKINIKSTKHLIQLVNDSSLPEQIIINTHPQRWFDPGIGWLNEFILQNIKNQAKKLVIINNRNFFIPFSFLYL
jgi:hypothetical protein